VIAENCKAGLSCPEITLHRGNINVRALSTEHEYQINLPVGVILLQSRHVADISSGLVAYYPFNGNTNDESGHNLHGTITGLTLIANRLGVLNSAYRFDGIDDSILLPDLSRFMDGNSMTVSAWVNQTGNKKSTIISNNSAFFTSLSMGIEQGGFGQYGVTSSHAEVQLNSQRILEGQWTHLTLAYDGYAAMIYFNGELFNSQSLVGKLNITQLFQIGHDAFLENNDSYWQGKIDELRIYNRALSLLDIRQLYQYDGTTDHLPRSDDSEPAEVSVDYTQEGTYGSANISVLSGMIEVLDNEGNWQTLSAGEELIISDQVPRTSWVIPVNGGSLYGGVINTLMWLTHPDAPGYSIEYNVPQPVFSEDNTDTLEYSRQALDFYADSYSQYEDLTFVDILMPDNPGLVIEARIFPIDEELNVLPDSVSSNSTTFIVE
jgi:hypothetical protein